MESVQKIKTKHHFIDTLVQIFNKIILKKPKYPLINSLLKMSI